MGNQLRRRDPVACVIGILALVVAMSGTAVAAGQIKGSQLVDRSVSHKKLVKNTITGVEIAEGTLGKVPRAAVADRANALPKPAVRSVVYAAGWGQGAWTNGAQPTGYVKDAQGFVHLQGEAQRLADDADGVGTVVFTLPPGFRPGGDVFVPVWTFAVGSAEIGAVKVYANGDVFFLKGKGPVVSFEGVVFRAYN